MLLYQFIKLHIKSFRPLTRTISEDMIKTLKERNWSKGYIRGVVD